MYICYEFYGNSNSQIGRAFHRDHTTVIHARQMVEHLISSGDQVNMDIAAITARIGAGVVVAGDA